tara:strand:- start:649 stop:1326 length:678 start_codon:yes stop_codon:yes gene_type:complete
MPKFKKIIRKKTEKELILEFVSIFKDSARKKERLKKRFSFVLTGGSSPINLYKSLSKIKINWKNIDLFWGDERFVSRKSNNSNYKLAKKFLIKNIDINKKNIYAINTNKKNANEAATAYSKKIKEYFKNKNKFFDLILLGMGLDGHIASLFPSNIKTNQNLLAKPVVREDFIRITLGLNLINKSKNICLWLNNRRKSNTLKKIKNKKNIPVNYLKKKNTNLFIIK